jgi:hypothetical protein
VSWSGEISYDSARHGFQLERVVVHLEHALVDLGTDHLPIRDSRVIGFSVSMSLIDPLHDPIALDRRRSLTSGGPWAEGGEASF